MGSRLPKMSDREVCCGFGGTFSIKYPDISNAMVTQKAERAVETKAEVLTGADLGCLMNIAGKLAREGKGWKCVILPRFWRARPASQDCARGNDPARIKSAQE